MELATPLSSRTLENLRCGQEVFLTGVVYTARDQAHVRLAAALRRGAKLPFELKGSIIYYCGPTGTPKGKVIGSCGPTTSRRMDALTPLLLSKGVAAMIGKGNRSSEVRRAIKRHKAVYFVACAGCGALISTYVQEASVVAFNNLGPEAVQRLRVERLPLVVAIDSRGKSVYKD
ncbi:MAG: FumA C-terminus/TtdB family hydratase beta subunit [Candidatus Omnitrophica bacterium]|nr:FumA C-terminus/TtdB family hydratase beta subunit [Candidatus Omnitrophota bacterium]